MGTVVGLIPRSLRTALGVLLVGGVLGFAASAAVTTFVTDQGWFRGSGESAQARAYMVSLLSRDAEQLTQLRPQTDVVSQAMAEQAAQQNSQQAKPLSLTYLGGGSSGRLSVHIYAVEVRSNDGVDHLFSLALTLFGGKVINTK